MRSLLIAILLLVSGPAFAGSHTLHFVAGSGARGIVDLLELTGDADRATVVAELGKDYEGVTEVRVAADHLGFRAMLPPGAQVPMWAQGVAFPEQNLVVVRASPGDADPRATMRHELSHVAVGRLAQHPVPRWFLEGLATIQAGDSWSRKGPSLVRAALTDGLFSFEFLEEGFPARAGDAELAYAQSADFVQFLVDRTSLEKLREVLRRMVAGEHFEDAFHNAMGSTRRAMENEWRRSLARWELLLRTVTSSELWWSTLGLLALYAGFLVRRRHKRRLQLLELQEQEEVAKAMAEAAAEWAERSAEEAREALAEAEGEGAFEEDEEDDEPPPEPPDAAPAKKPTLH